VREARRISQDSIIVAWVDANGAPAVRYERTSFPSVLVKVRKEQVEDWVAVLVASHLFSAADALVSAILWDLPAELALQRRGGTQALGLRLRF
jgi:hypothetical protein